MRFLFPVLMLATAASAAPTAPAITFDPIAAPAGPGALAPAFTSSADGRAWLSWVEPRAARETGGTRRYALRCAAYDPAAATWTSVATIAADATVAANMGDVPQLAIAADHHAYAVWNDGKGREWFSESADGASTWNTPQPWAGANVEVEKFALTALAHGHAQAVWLDSRERQKGGRAQALYARVLGVAPSPDVCIDASVCDCCQTSVIGFLDGGALVAYRGRTDDEIRDIRVARRQAGKWSQGRTINPDGWKLTACPVNGPRLATDGSRVACAWFTAADGDPRVLVSYSPDAGERWLMPLRADEGHPAGHVDVALLADQAILVTWVESDGSIWLRRVTPDFANADAVQLASPRSAAINGIPRLLVTSNYVGGGSAAKAVLGYARAGTERGLGLLALSVPEGDLLNRERACACAPTAEELQGFPIRGTIQSVASNPRTVVLRHGAVPGVFPAETTAFRVEDGANPPPQREILGRIVRRGGSWWLFDIRLLASGMP